MQLFKKVLSTFTLILCMGIMPAQAEKSIIVASTTSMENSGFYKYILPLFTKDTGISVKYISQGTGQAIETARRGDVDVLFVHHKASELKFIQDGHGINRYKVMYNDFVIVGPKSDPSKVKSALTIEDAFTKLASAKANFISRGDDSGTHKRELSLWKNINITPKGKWYVETGSGMGVVLNMVASKNAYTITDRSTWLSFNNKKDLTIVFEGSKKLFNQYALISINPKKHPHIKSDLSNIFIKWFISPHGQKTIANFKIMGKQAFVPNAMQKNN